ncbi:vacuolar import/degradation protein Vid24 [Dichotomocladium elegans]|nr:vacuolar import/degradation protein Vid24 [Dichotomocladium elegans]
MISPHSLAITVAQANVARMGNQRLPNSRLGSLYPGSRFQGVQHCGSSNYDVAVEIQHVDLKESTLCGYLKISGLTSEYPELTTFFQAEIIGPRYSFLTRKWQAQKSVDASHWKRFPSFKPYLNVFNNDDFVYDPYGKDFIYMRWKEKFLVPDHRVSNIDGASFEGFYYICYQRSTDEIKGYYYFSQHTESSRFQELQLKHIVDRSFGSYEMR